MEPLVEVATELEKIALKDEYFISRFVSITISFKQLIIVKIRKLYPNVDFYTGLIYKYLLKTAF